MKHHLSILSGIAMVFALSGPVDRAYAGDVWYPPRDSNAARAPAGTGGDRGADPSGWRPVPSPAEKAQRGPTEDRRTPRQGDAGGWSRRAGESRPAAASPAPGAAVFGLPPSGSALSVERADLTPVMAADGSGLPFELWRGLDVSEVERLLASMTIPPRSPALHDLWRRLITARTDPPPGASADDQFKALRLEALYRSGLLEDIVKEVATTAAPATAVIAMMQARSEIGLGNRDQGCAIAKRLGDIRDGIPKSLRGEAILVAGYCAAASGNAAAAGLLAALAREEGIKRSPGLAALDAVAAGAAADIPDAGKGGLTLVDYRILQLAGAGPVGASLVETATPALLVAIVADDRNQPAVRLEAAEAAAKLNVIAPQRLADLYLRLATETGGATADTPGGRAASYRSARAERTPFKKVRMIRGFLDAARRAGLYAPGLVLAHVLAGDVGLAPEIGWFAETAIEAHLAAGDYAKARVWIRFAASLDTGRGSLDHWMALADIADKDYPEPRGAALATVERLALGGRFSADMLHRLATVLDALDYQVPLALWEAASRTPQPSGGHLPETGVLSRLQQAAKERAFGRTVLLAMQTLGKDGADGAHIIALGDAIRALKRAGLEADARRLAFEALIAGWPRTLTN